MKLRNSLGYIFVMLTFGMSMLCGCKAAKGTAQENQTVEESPVMGEMKVKPTVGNTPSSMIPKAVIYQTNGDYNQNVPVVLNAEGTSLVSYPAPTDITAASCPVVLKDGWLLDRRGGVGQNTAFLKYTYEEYSKLASVNPQMIMAAILPDAHVTKVKQLPININEALSDPEKVNQYID